MSDTNTYEEDNPKDIIGRTKPGLHNMPCPVLFEVGQVNDHGADKYGTHNWRDAQISGSVYYNAAMRHLMQWWSGEDIDPDSGIHHISHAIAGLMIARDAMMQDKFVDDRPTPAKPGWVEQIRKNIQ